MLLLPTQRITQHAAAIVAAPHIQVQIGRGALSSMSSKRNAIPVNYASTATAQGIGHSGGDSSMLLRPSVVAVHPANTAD